MLRYALAGLLIGAAAAGAAAHEDVTGVALVRLVDGDTAWFEVHGERRKVRFLGVDTPEIHGHCPAEEARAAEASAYTAAALTGAHQIDLLNYQPGADRYGRDLAAVRVDGRDLAAELIGAGLGRPYVVRRASWCQ